MGILSLSKKHHLLPVIKSLSNFLIQKRLFSLSTTTTSIPSPLFSFRPITPLSHAFPSLPCIPPTRFTSIRCCSGNSVLDSESEIESDVDAYENLSLCFPGLDYEHWIIDMKEQKNPDGGAATKLEMIDIYIKTLATVVGSEEEAKKRIYKILYNPNNILKFGFGCELDWETASKLLDLPNVDCTIPDAYIDPEYKDYGGELFVNGEIVQRSPERQRRLDMLFMARPKFL